MKTRSAWLHELWREQPGLFRGYVVDTLTALTIAVLLVSGGRQHTQAPAWDVVNDNGGPMAWGLVLCALGVLLGFAGLLGPRVVTWMLWVLALYYLVLAVAFFESAWHDPAHSASYFGVVLLTRAAVMHVSRAQGYLEGTAAA